MDIFKVIILGILGSAAALVVRSYRPELGMQVALACGIAILILASDWIVESLGFLGDAAMDYGVGTSTLQSFLKVVGIAYLTQFATDICKDAGETAIAGRVEFAGRAMLLCLCLPVAKTVLELVKTLFYGGGSA